MKTMKRVLRALFIRIIFMAYSLMCIWRITFVSDNKYFWLMMISIGFLLIETAILLWLRAGKEFRGILPSVLFFLSCVVPCLWIMFVDEAHRKSQFHLVAENQEGKIKDFVHTLDLSIAAKKKTLNNLHSLNASAIIKNILSNGASTTSFTTTHQQRIKRFEEELANQAFALALKVDGISTTTLPTTTKKTNLKSNLNNKIVKSGTSQVYATKRLDPSVDCCDVKISYLFQEDGIQRLYIQCLVLILIVSRWLITRAEINLNQRSLILVISVATAADILDFFSYFSMEMVYRNNYMLYTALFIVTLSLVQFVFLHVEDSLNLANSFMNRNSSITESSTNSLNDTGDDDKQKLKKKSAKKPKGKFSNLYKRYKHIKDQLKADEPAAAISDRILKDKLERYHKKPSGQAIINGFPMKKDSATRYFCYIVCCCMENQDPLFFILLAGLILHDGSYLSFRMFTMSKLGFENTLNQCPSLLFFMIKNIFIIVTQIYKVYSVTNEKKQKKLIQNYRDLVSYAAHHDHMTPPNINTGTLRNQMNPNSYFMPHAAQIATAAAGGQVPLLNHPQQAFFNYQQQAAPPYYTQGPTNNPYRFAQIYTSNNVTSNSPISPNRYQNRSISTLGSVANTTVYNDNPQTQQANQMIKQQQQHQHQYYTGFNDKKDIYYNQSQQSSFSMPVTESMIYNTQGNRYQQYDQNILMCQSPNKNTNKNKMSTPANPFTAKVGKALYGLPFMSRSKSSLSALNEQSTTSSSYESNIVASTMNGVGLIGSFRQSYRSSSLPAHPTNPNKLLKASKI